MTRWITFVLLAFVCLSSSAFCIHNHTDAKFNARVSYEGWTFKKTFNIKPHETFCKRDIDPGKPAKYKLSNRKTNIFHTEIISCSFDGSTSGDIQINGFWNFFHCIQG